MLELLAFIRNLCGTIMCLFFSGLGLVGMFPLTCVNFGPGTDSTCVIVYVESVPDVE